MTYKINSTELDPQPTAGKWLPRQIVGMDGAGRPIYVPTRQFEISWGLLDETGYNALQDYFSSIAATGTAIVDLPRYTSGTYEFQSYTGCYVHEPEANQYFTQHHQSTKLLITNIVTEK